MASLKLYNMQAKEVGSIEVNDELFQMEYKEALIHQAVVTRLANERQGTKSTLTRTEVRGGGIKPWRQKGTGRARQGSIRAPQWIKGGVVFAPKSRDFSKKMNITAKRVALFSALSKKVADGELVAVESLAAVTGKTKEMAAFLKAMNYDRSVLLVLDEKNDAVLRASANIQKLHTIPVELINTYDVVANVNVVATKAALEKLQEVYGE